MSELVRAHLPCPECGSSDALAEYSDGGTYCFACETYGNTSKEVIEMPSELIKGNLRALHKRSISKDTCAKFGYTVGSFKDTTVHIAPYYQGGDLVGQHLRFPDKNFIWLGDSKGVELFGQKLWQPRGRLIITEGEIDCMSISQAFNNSWAVVSLPSGVGSVVKALKNNLEFLSGFDDIVLAFDADEPGRKATEKAIDILGKVRVCSYPSDCKDANDVLVKHGAKAVVSVVFEAQTERPDGILVGEELWDIVKAPIPEGLELPYPELQDSLQGLRKGIYMVTAGSGIGKSTLVHEIGYDILTRHKEKLGVIALEDGTQKSALRYPSLYLNKRLDLEQATEEELREAFDATINNDRFYLFDHFGSLDETNLITKIKFMIKSLGVKYIILDHISIVISGLGVDNERKAIDMLMTSLRSIAEETECVFLCVVHINRGGTNANRGEQISLRDLRGSGALEQLSDVVIALERDQQDEATDDISTIRILKNRTTGVTGEVDTLVYSKETGRLLPEYIQEFE
jgi:twinkle protein